jgi:hypothetical protein
MSRACPINSETFYQVFGGRREKFRSRRLTRCPAYSVMTRSGYAVGQLRTPFNRTEAAGLREKHSSEAIQPKSSSLASSRSPTRGRRCLPVRARIARAAPDPARAANTRSASILRADMRGQHGCDVLIEADTGPRCLGGGDCLQLPGQAAGMWSWSHSP